MIVGRKLETEKLLGLLDKDESQFCAVYGRRRVGKTFLIRETFNRNFAFQHTGLANSDMEDQLDEFRASLKKYGLKDCNSLKNWREAFHKLAELLEQSTDKKKVVFIDELSWLDTPKSKFVSALEHFWNSWATARKEQDIVLIVCGSATYWIINNIVNNHGGLHNRLTSQIFLKPFNLNECERFCNAKGLNFSQTDIVEGYMVMGGIPYYWNYLNTQYSMSQNIDKLFFGEDSPLRNEFSSLYYSLYKNPIPHLAILSALGNNRTGLSRKEILEATKMSDNKTFASALEELEQCSFVRKYYSFGKKTKDALFQLIDNFTLFYYKYILKNERHNEAFYTNSINSQTRVVWQGLAFERVCLSHLNQIKQKLGIIGVNSCANSWSVKATELHDGAQIDLLIDRDDKTINICEAKYYNAEFAIDSKYAEDLRNKMNTFRIASKTNKTIKLTMITTFGLRRNAYSSVVDSVVKMEELFKEEIL